MLTKIAFNNAVKSFRDYAVYFFTLVLGVSIFYMFNSIYAQQAIMVVTETTSQSMMALREILSYISIFVAVILGFLIVYANNFFIKKRKKELGIYLILGMTKFKISIILVLETSIMALIALAVGLCAGIFGSQFMSVFTARIFEADMTAFKFIFSPDAMVKSIAYFGTIFAITILFNTALLGKFKLIDLLYGAQKNESLKIKNIRTSVILFFLSVICLALSYYLILENGIININIYFMLSLMFGTVGTVLFFLSLSGFFIKMVQSNKKLYYRNLNIFVLRQLNSKINTNFVSVSVVCIVLLLVIGIFSSGFSMQKALSKNFRELAPYDFSLSIRDRDEAASIIENLPNDLKNHPALKDYYEFNTYVMDKEGGYWGNYPLDTSSLSYHTSDRSLSFLSLTDYNKSCELQGLKPISLSEGEYAVFANYQTFLDIGKQFIEKQIVVSIDGIDLTPFDEIQEISISNEAMADINVIVNDNYTKNMTISNTTLNLQAFDQDSAAEFQKAIENYKQDSNADPIFDHFTSRIDLRAASVTATAIVSFLAIYLGIVFMITCAAILSIQQLSEAADNKERYHLLKKLGAERSMLNKALFLQILCYFLLPLLLAVVHSAVGLTAVNQVISEFGNMNITSSIFVTSIFVVFVYGLYFVITYSASKNIINKD